MSVIVLDGPEKAGKTSFARALQREDPRVRYRHWGPVAEHGDYYEALMEDVARPYPVVWDRSWASESVYARLLGRPRVLADDPFLGEWLYGRSAISNGLRIMLAPSEMVLTGRRYHAADPNDLPVDPGEERAMFLQYADQWGWSVFMDAPPSTVQVVLRKSWHKLREGAVYRPPVWAGRHDARVVFVGDRRNPNAQFQIPFASDYTARYGRALGPIALRCGWTNTDFEPALLHGPRLVACGGAASTWLEVAGLPHEMVPHPAWLYRWGNASDQIIDAEHTIRRIVREAYGSTHLDEFVDLQMAPATPARERSMDNG